MERAYCHICKLYKQEGSRHCHYCVKCVKGYDHHCGFFGKCIGSRNYLMFCGFLISSGGVGMGGMAALIFSIFSNL